MYPQGRSAMSRKRGSDRKPSQGSFGKRWWSEWASRKPIISQEYNESLGEYLWRVTCLPEKSVIKASPIDRAVARIVSARVAREPHEGYEADLIGDLMLTMYRSSLELKDKDQVPISRKINQLLIDWATSIPGFDEGRVASSGNVISSVLSAGLLWHTLMTEEALAEAFKKQKEIEELL